MVEVRVTTGAVRGTEEAGVAVFRGIPFAEAFERHANMPYAEFQRKLGSN